MSKDKKQQQLGMNPSTASGRLVKDTLWRLVEQTGQTSCHRCGFDMNRDSFSIEHKEAWLDSDNPVGKFFDQNNISFSHLVCNVSDARKVVPVIEHGTRGKYRQGCKCSECVEANNAYNRSIYTAESRNDRYQRTGN